ncbi:TKL protein kinase [Saprolegnia parasitica CBS 223.65]|uniref:TKL protein kinase n=1 Tax=Saprolegnia parasitica (strain CBS 223.65) TaxID=695850 RepID=A0A067CUY9_SAPPC|nr:TKL protein kinase [Saprolegnia parasitica CBS 223.65]KDO34524.1 TKL protein kinase [Saprolegnia parasitica CBS 223.65]|eukprot:XP_012194202.1 TKL protein kinase [Saprolegnia parasitica CBS 223.65]
MVLATPLRPISHWDLYCESVASSVAYFALWKGLCVWLLATTPVLLLALDVQTLPPLRTDLQLFLDDPHPLVYRAGVLAYCALGLYVCDLLASAMVVVTSKVYGRVFKAAEAFQNDLRMVAIDAPVLPSNALTTYSQRSQTQQARCDTEATSSKTLHWSLPPSAPTPPAFDKAWPPHSVQEHDHEDDVVQTFAKPARRRLNIGRILATSASPPSPPSSTLYDRLSPAVDRAARPYDPLSPPADLSREARQGVFRALPTTPSAADIHFAAYGPLCVGILPFALDIWAFESQQRDDVHAEATTASCRALSRDVLLSHVARGTLVHVSLDALPEGFALLSETASHTLVWHGDIEHVSFPLQATAPQSGHVLFTCTIIIGHQVQTLRTYILSHPSHGDDEANVQLLESTMEVQEAGGYTEIAYADLTIKELVGAGASGDAYRASYRGQEVVVKTLRQSAFGDKQDAIVQEFQHEAAVLDKFGKHPRIVPFIGACSDLAFPLSLVTAYVPHGSLETHRSHLSSLQKDLVLADMAAATATIHAAGFVHRDLAARNCLVDSAQRGVLADFGLCRRVSSLGGAFVQEGVGPLKYMAPETLTPPYTFTPRSDAFAFGVMIWETLTEASPFASLSPLQAAVRVLEGDRLPTVELRPRHQALLQACFQADPMRRPTMEEIYTILLEPDASQRTDALEPPIMVRRAARVAAV